jgi:hypothetical protein
MLKIDVCYNAVKGFRLPRENAQAVVTGKISRNRDGVP